MRVLVACEFSGRVRNAFSILGHDAWSCDLIPTEQEGNHIIGDVLDYLNDDWDLMIAHPPCTYLACSGARWFSERMELQAEAIQFVIDLWNAPISLKAIENPRGVLSTALWPPDQEIQPHWFGDPESKLTCLWLDGLPTLKATHRIPSCEIKESIHREPPGPDRAKNRSRTFLGIAIAMASQWGRV